MQALEKGSKLWNDVKASPSNYQELIIKVEKRISFKKSKNAAVWKFLSGKHKNYHKHK